MISGNVENERKQKTSGIKSQTSNGASIDAIVSKNTCTSYRKMQINDNKSCREKSISVSPTFSTSFSMYSNQNDVTLPNSPDIFTEDKGSLKDKILIDFESKTNKYLQIEEKFISSVKCQKVDGIDHQRLINDCALGFPNVSSRIDYQNRVKTDIINNETCEIIKKSHHSDHCRVLNSSEDIEHMIRVNEEHTQKYNELAQNKATKSFYDNATFVNRTLTDREELICESVNSLSPETFQSKVTRASSESLKAEKYSSDLASKTNLIVNYLPPFMSQDEVKALFSSIGEVETCKLVREKSSGESLGYAFVKYFKIADADKAIKSLNGLRLQNKTIKVSLARPSSESIKGANLYICGLPRKMTQAELKELFSQCGKIITARILYDNKTGLSRGIAFIRFDQKHEAEQAICRFNGYQPLDENGFISSQIERITVKFANSPNSIRHESIGHKMSSKSSPMQQEFMNPQFRPTTVYSGFLNSEDSLGNFSSELRGNAIFENTGMPVLSKGGDLFPPEVKATTLINPIFAPAVAASSGALTANGWCIFVCNLYPEADESSLWQLFGPFGAVQTVKLIRDAITNKCNGCGFVGMCNYEDAILAINSLNGFEYGNRILQVAFKTTVKSETNNFAASRLFDNVHGLGDSLSFQRHISEPLHANQESHISASDIDVINQSGTVLKHISPNPASINSSTE